MINFGGFGTEDYISLGANDTVDEKFADGEIRIMTDKLKSIKAMIVRGSRVPKVVKLARQIQIDAKRAEILRKIKNTSDENRKRKLSNKLKQETFAEFRHKDKRVEIKNVWQWMKQRFHYFNDPVGQECINEAESQVKHFKEGWLSGDCDEFTVAAGALLRAIGIMVRVVLWRKPHGEWQHIFIIAYDPKRGKWFAVDATEKTKPFNYVAKHGVFKEFKFKNDSLPKAKLGGIFELGGFINFEGNPAQFDGFFSNIKKFFKKTAAKVKVIAKKSWDVAKKAAAPLVSNLVGMIPGIPPVIKDKVAALAGSMVNKLVNGGKPNKALKQMNARLKAGKDPKKLLNSLVNHNAMAAFKAPIMAQVKSLLPQLQNINYQQNQRQGAQQAAQIYARQVPNIAAQAWARNQYVQQQVPGATPQNYYQYYQPPMQYQQRQPFYPMQRQQMQRQPYYPMQNMIPPQRQYQQPMRYASFAEMIPGSKSNSEDLAETMLLGYEKI